MMNPLSEMGAVFFAVNLKNILQKVFDIRIHM